jgi:hypothetical protein
VLRRRRLLDVEADLFLATTFLDFAEMDGRAGVETFFLTTLRFAGILGTGEISRHFMPVTGES